jgi:hypothetical protein
MRGLGLTHVKLVADNYLVNRSANHPATFDAPATVPTGRHPSPMTSPSQFDTNLRAGAQESSAVASNM